ncbi:MAG TPA: VOC family protein [Egibacteraceae bacterium]
MTLSPTPAAVGEDLAGDPPTLGEQDGFTIYPMPVYTTVPVTDVVASARWYVDALGFGIMYVGPEVAGAPVVVHLRRGKYQDILLTPAQGDVTPAPASGAAQVALAGGDLEALAARARSVPAVGRSSVEGPVPTPWGAPELRVTDPDGHRLVFWGAPEQPPAHDIDTMLRAAAERVEQ